MKSAMVSLSCSTNNIATFAGGGKGEGKEKLEVVLLLHRVAVKLVPLRLVLLCLRRELLTDVAAEAPTRRVPHEAARATVRGGEVDVAVHVAVHAAPVDFEFNVSSVDCVRRRREGGEGGEGKVGVVHGTLLGSVDNIAPPSGGASFFFFVSTAECPAAPRPRWDRAAGCPSPAGRGSSPTWPAWGTGSPSSPIGRQGCWRRTGRTSPGRGRPSPRSWPTCWSALRSWNSPLSTNNLTAKGRESRG